MPTERQRPTSVYFLPSSCFLSPSSSTVHPLPLSLSLPFLSHSPSLFLCLIWVSSELLSSTAWNRRTGPVRSVLLLCLNPLIFVMYIDCIKMQQYGTFNLKLKGTWGKNYDTKATMSYIVKQIWFSHVIRKCHVYLWLRTPKLFWEACAQEKATKTNFSSLLTFTDSHKWNSIRATIDRQFPWKYIRYS